MLSKINIIDPGLCSKAGHHYSMDKALKDAAESDIEVLGFRNMPLVLQEEPWIKPVLTDWIYYSRYTDPVDGWLDNFIDMAETLEKDLEGVFVQDGEVWLAHTINHWSLYGIAKFLNKTKSTVKFKATLALPGVRDANGSPTINTVMYRKAVKELKRWGGEFDIGVQTEWTMADAIAIGITPSICPAFPFYQVEPKGIEDAPVFGFLGHSTGVKGFQLLYDAAQVDLDGRYLAQINPVQEIPNGNIMPLYGELDEKGYLGALSMMDAVILPYNKEYYRNHASAVFLEAICSGRPVVIPADTWMEFEAKRMGVGYEVFISGQVSSLVIAIQSLRKNWTDHHAKSLAALPKVRHKYNVKRYIEWVKK